MITASTFDLVWVTAAVVAAGAATVTLAIGSHRLRVWAPAIHVAATTAILAARTMQIGRLPVFGPFENTIVAGWAASVVIAASCFSAPTAIKDRLARALAPCVPLILVAGAAFSRSKGLMGANERALIGYAHGYVGWFGFGLFLSATVTAVLVLRAEGRKDSDGETLSAHLFRLLCFGFAWLTATMASGALYSFLLFSDWYQWQIVEVLSALIWLGYALLIHAHLLFGWKTRRLAIGVLAAGPLLLATYWIWSFLPITYHYFGGS